MEAKRLMEGLPAVLLLFSVVAVWGEVGAQAVRRAQVPLVAS